MEKNIVLNGNKLIAEFMGAKRTDIEGLQKSIWYPISGKSEYEHKLKYHSSWDWLMPVCKHIINMYKSNREGIFKALTSCDINKTYKAVLEFIEFWNNPQSIIYTWKDVPFPYNPMPKGTILGLSNY